MAEVIEQTRMTGPNGTERSAAGGDEGMSALRLISLGGLAVLIVLALRHFGWLEATELAVYDQSVRWRSNAIEQPTEVAVIGFTDADLARWGWPVPDEVLNTLIQNATAAGAAVIGVDVYRDIGVPPGSDELDKTLRENPSVVGVMKYPSDQGAGVAAPPSIVEADKNRVGFTDMVLDEDGFVRRGLLYLAGRGNVESSLSLQSVRLHLKSQGIVPVPAAKDDPVLKLGATVFRPLTTNFGGFHEIDAQGYQFLLDFRRAPSEIPFVVSSDLFDNKTDPAVIEGKILLVGVTSEQVKDHFILPVSGSSSQRATFGVFLHALATDQILRLASGAGAPTRSLSQWQESLLIVVLTALVAFAAARRRRPSAYIMLGIGAGVLCLVAGYAALLADWWLPSVPAALATVLTAFALLSWRALHDRRERMALASLLTNQVSSQVAKELWENRRIILQGRKPRPSRLMATVLFVDIAGSTTVADELAPDQLVTWVSDFLEEMAEAAVQNNGVVEKFTGDGLMAVFGIPVPRTQRDEIERDANNAVACALSMRERLDRLNTRRDADVFPRMRSRIGIHTGVLSAGSVGTRARMQYTVIGQTANLAARLEGFGKDDPKIACDASGKPLDCRILLSAATVDLLPEAYNVESMGELELRGAQVPLTVYRLADGGALKSAEGT